MMPTLQTDRLVLRPFRATDALAVSAHCGEWRIARMLARVPHPYSLEMAEAWIASRRQAADDGAEHSFCIELGGEAVGSIGLRKNGEGKYELGYWLGQACWGKGFATEAAFRVLYFAFDDLGAKQVVSGHFSDNPASGRVLEKCGFRYTGNSMEECAARGEAVEHRNFELGRAEWAEQR